MSIQTSLANATYTATSLFAKLLLAAAVIFVLLLLTIYFGWSMLAGFFFMVAGLATSVLCFFADAAKGLFGKGRAVGLGIISLYLSLTATLAYATPDLFSGLGLNGWMGLTTIFFTATAGGSLTLISFEKASKVVAVLVILFTSFGLVSGHVFARGVQYLAGNAASALGRKAYSMGAEFEDSEGDINVKYLAEYQVKKAALEKEWESGKITAKVYEEKRKALDKEYEQALKPQPNAVQTVSQAAPISPKALALDTKTIVVSAQKMWTDTGISTKKGDHIQLEAAGSVNTNLISGDASFKWVGPEGWGYQPQFSRHGKPNMYVPIVGKGSSFMCLTVKVGLNGKPLCAGSNFSLPVEDSGQVYIGVNDSIIDPDGNRIESNDNFYWNENAGSFTVKIGITRRQ